MNAAAPRGKTPADDNGPEAQDASAGTKDPAPSEPDQKDPQAPQDDQAPAGDPSAASVKDPGVHGDAKATGDGAVGSGIGHQEGAPEALTRAADESRSLGFVAPEQNPTKPTKPDYSQANPAVMNQG